MNVDQLKYNIMEKKTLLYKHILDERLLTYFKEKDPIYAGEVGPTKKHQNK